MTLKFIMTVECNDDSDPAEIESSIEGLLEFHVNLITENDDVQISSITIEPQ